MNIFSRAIAKAASLFPRVMQASLPSGSLEFLNRFGKLPDVSQEALVRKYWGWTWMCTQLGAVRLASTPLKLYASRSTGQSYVKNFTAHMVDRQQTAWLRKRLAKSLPNVAGAEDFEELEEHPLLDLLQNVNDQENGFEMKELTSIMLDLTGNGYWYIEKDKMNVPSKLFVLRSQWVRIVPDRDKFVKEYIYGINQFGQEAVHIAQENVIHFKYPNPLDPWYGMGPVQAAAYAIESSELREKFVLATMSNMARPDLIVKYLEGELDPKERGLVEREWNAMFRGAKNAGKVKVTDYRYEIDKVGWTPSELDFNKGEDWIMKKICGAFPVPIGLVDTTQISRAPRAGMEGADLFMAQFNTLPRCTRIEEKLNEQLCPMYDGERLFVAFDNPVPKDVANQRAEDQFRLTNYLTTVNEIRQRDGEEEVEWGDLPLTSPGIAPLGSQPQPSATGGDAANPANNNATAPAPDGGGSTGGALFGNKKPEEKPQPTETEQAVLEQAKKAFSDGMSMEVDGQYVSPSLAGIPVRLRVRNEGGRFDRRGVGRLRASRDVVESLKGGAGSGNFGHEGRPGERGGSGGGGSSGERSVDTFHNAMVKREAALKLSAQATTQTDIANGIGDTALADHSGYKDAAGEHRTAAHLHRQAAEALSKAGEEALASSHTRMAGHYDTIADKFDRLEASHNQAKPKRDEHE